MFYKRIASYLFKYPMPIWKLVYKNLVQAENWERGVNEKTFLANQTSPDNKMVGWEYNCDEQTNNGWLFNMILKDGTRSDNPFTLRGTVIKRYDYYLPQNNKITEVTIYYHDYWITGFRFHLSDGSNWDIGFIAGYDETVNIADNEVIVGFKAKSHPDCPAEYTEFQFITARGLF